MRVVIDSNVFISAFCMSLHYSGFHPFFQSCLGFLFGFLGGTGLETDRQFQVW